MIGNDIVDLNYARHTSKASHPRWAEKVLTAQEKEQLKLFPSPASALWSFWALKESAYKIFYKKTGKRLFIPKKFQSSLTHIQPDFLEACIESPLGKWYGQVQISSDTVHALAVTQKKLFQQITYQTTQLKQTTSSHQSSETRKSLCLKLQQQCRLPAEEFRIESPRYFPQVFVKNKLLPIDVSMSHHHQWGAFAFLQVDQ